jgi:hypothetical protein
MLVTGDKWVLSLYAVSNQLTIFKHSLSLRYPYPISTLVICGQWQNNKKIYLCTYKSKRADMIHFSDASLAWHLALQKFMDITVDQNCTEWNNCLSRMAVMYMHFDYYINIQSHYFSNLLILSNTAIQIKTFTALYYFVIRFEWLKTRLIETLKRRLLHLAIYNP